MSDHSKVLVPLESWSYHSPEIRFHGGLLDIGLLAEALIYYDQILINVSNQPQFAELLSWFVKQGKYPDLIALFNDQTIQVYDYAFISAPVYIQKDGIFDFLNIQDPVQEKPNTFRQRFLYHDSIKGVLKHNRDRIKLYKSLDGKVIEVKASEFGRTIENAKADIFTPKRYSLIVQALLDEVYPMLNWGTAPDIITQVTQSPGLHHVTVNIDYEQLGKALGKDLNFGKATPLTAAVLCNRFLWSAANLNCDLYLGRPISSLVGDKLYETEYTVHKVHNTINQLIAEVDFPDIQNLVNTGKLNLDDILLFRKKALKFRKWLQEEGERDQNAIIPYHNEVAKEAGWTKLGRKSLQVFGILGGSATGSYVGLKVAGIPGAVLGASAGKGVEYLFDLASKLGANWKPIVFGNWLKERIEKLMNKKD